MVKSPKMEDTVFYQKMIRLMKKIGENGFQPRAKIEEQMSREFRLTREEIRQTVKEFNLNIQGLNGMEKQAVPSKKPILRREVQMQNQPDFFGKSTLTFK